MNKKIKLLIGALLITMVGSFAGCGNSNKEGESSVTITVSGSTSVGPVMGMLAEAYEKENDDISIEINEVGSSAGIQDTISGVSEIGMSSRDLKDEEAGEVDGTVIAYDGIAVIINTANKVKDISIDDLKKIYTGEITNWKELGGADKAIVVVSREEGSGTRDAFQEIVGFESSKMVPEATITDASGNLKTTVSQNENAIGYVSFSYVDDTINTLTLEGVEPEAENAKDGSYLLSRPFLLVTKEDTLTDEGEKLLEYVLSDKGQEIIKEEKLITVD